MPRSPCTVGGLSNKSGNNNYNIKTEQLFYFQLSSFFVLFYFVVVVFLSFFLIFGAL